MNHHRRGTSTGQTQIPRRSVGSARRWRVLVLCSCLWMTMILLVVRIAGDGHLFLTVPSLQAATPTSYFRSDCHGGDSTATATAKRAYVTTDEEIRALFDRWNDALLGGDPGAVADLYYTNHDEKEKSHPPLVLLLPTMSNEPRTNRASVEDYFATFLKRKPRGRIVSGQILIGPDKSWAQDAGIYEFDLRAPLSPPFEDTGSRVGGAASSTTNETNHNGENVMREGNTSIVRARYTFLYLRDCRGEWKIAHHHSSLMPEND